MDKLTGFLGRNGYTRSDTVMEPGEYALRGGIVDLFPPGSDEPLRIDFFGDEIEEIRTFDPISQRSTAKSLGVILHPMSEAVLDEEAISRFRTRYRQMFDTRGIDQDPLYAAISEGRKYAGMDHWLPLFHEGMDTLFAYVPDGLILWDHQADEALTARFEQIWEYYEARRSMAAQGLSGESGAPTYHPIPPS